MKTMRSLSYLAIVIIISTMVVAYFVATKHKTYFLKEDFKVLTYKQLKPTIKLPLEKTENPSAPKFKMMETTKPALSSTPETGTPEENKTYVKQDDLLTNEFDQTKFIIKIIFSAIFTVVCLYIVLSNKYEDGTKKWAFSVLSLITGVWIGAAI